MVNKSDDLNTAVTVGIVELLFRPDYSVSWVRELVEEYSTADTTDENVEAVETAIWKALGAMASPFIDSLPDDVRKHYRKE